MKTSVFECLIYFSSFFLSCRCDLRLLTLNSNISLDEVLNLGENEVQVSSVELLKSLVTEEDFKQESGRSVVSVEEVDDG